MYDEVVSPSMIYAHHWWWPMGLEYHLHGPPCCMSIQWASPMAVLVTSWIARGLDVWWA